MSSPRIVLYATASCPYCAEARAAITSSGESWEERNPLASPEALRELLMHATAPESAEERPEADPDLSGRG
jgi:glutaredoxin